MSESNAKLGRPRFPEGMARTVRLTVRVTPSEQDLLQACAVRSGQTLTEYVRKWSVSKAQRDLGGVLGHPECADPWHLYSYTMDQPDGRARRIPATCPGCGDSAPPHVTRRGDFEHDVDVTDPAPDRAAEAARRVGPDGRWAGRRRKACRHSPPGGHSMQQIRATRPHRDAPAALRRWPRKARAAHDPVRGDVAAAQTRRASHPVPVDLI